MAEIERKRVAGQFDSGGNKFRWRCPRCNSDNIQKLSVIHAAGTATNSSVGAGFGLMGGAGAMGMASGTGISETNLARLARPPRCAWANPILILVCVVLASSVLGLAGFFGSLSIWIALGLIERSVLAPRIELWQRSYFCNRCGRIFAAKALDECAI